MIYVGKSNKDTSKRAFKGWMVLLLTAVICVIIAAVYRFGFNDQELEEKNGPLAPSDISKEEKDEGITQAIVDLDDFMVAPSAVTTVFKTEPTIRGIFLTANTAGISKSLDNLIQLANDTEVNAFVIDVKNDDGEITYNMDLKLVDDIGAEKAAIRDINVVMDKLYDNNIYPIARIVAFKDPYLSKKMTDYAIKNQDGSLFMYKNISWLNPYNEDSWKYIVDVAKEAAKSGFKEIQFDYIRFEATRTLETADFGDIDPNISKIDVITHFLDYANKELEPYDVVVSADVFGTIIQSEVDAKIIGQNYLEMAKRLDVICPMVYPSHYGRGYFGLPSSEPPDLHPYEIIYGSMEASRKLLETAPETQIKVRPWLQAFTASYLPNGEYMTYDGDAIREQIQGAYDAGLTEWLLWNSRNKYDMGGLELE